MSSVVYISNMSRDHDYTAAAQFGAIVPVTSGNYPIFKTSRLIEDIIKQLVNSTEDDYLLLSGSSVIAGICMSVWIMMHKEVRLLLHDRRQNRYVPRVFDRDATLLEIERAVDRLQRTRG